MLQEPSGSREKNQGIFRDPEGFVRARAHLRFRHGPYLRMGLRQAPTLPGFRICRIKRVTLPLATPDLSTAQGRGAPLALRNRRCACFSKP